jgi:hypothetical protein
LCCAVIRIYKEPSALDFSKEFFFMIREPPILVLWKNEESENCQSWFNFFNWNRRSAFSALYLLLARGGRFGVLDLFSFP